MQISQNSVSNSGQVLTSPPRFLLTKMHFLFLFSLSSACERVNYSLPVSNLDMNYDSRVRPCCVHLVVASKDNSRKETVRKRLIERLTGFFFLFCRLQQRKWYIENKAGSHNTNIILTQI